MIENYDWKLTEKYAVTIIENYDWKQQLKTMTTNYDWKQWLNVIIKYSKNRKSIALVGIMFLVWSLDGGPKLCQLKYKSV